MTKANKATCPIFKGEPPTALQSSKKIKYAMKTISFPICYRFKGDMMVERLSYQYSILKRNDLFLSVGPLLRPSSRLILVMQYLPLIMS